jgi:molybdate transport system substrate-binding protein
MPQNRTFMRFLTLLSLLIWLLIVTGCRDSQPQADTLSGELVVFTAASLTDAFIEIGNQFEQAYSGSSVTFNIAGSSQLAQQLAQGAPADVFASANDLQMRAAVTAGRIVSGSQQTFAHNRLVVALPSGNPAGIGTLADLARPGVIVLLAEQSVPVGAYSLEFLWKASQDPALGSDYQEKVLANTVSYEQNVRTVLSKVTLGEADAGIVYHSDITAAGVGEVEQIDIPDHLNTVASYPIAVVRDSQQMELAETFVAYLLSPQGQQILAGAGLIPVNEVSSE